MASKLPWTTPKVQTLYTTSSVGRLIAEYLDAGGQMLQMREGVLGHGDVLLYLCHPRGGNQRVEQRPQSQRLQQNAGEIPGAAG